MTNTLDDPDSTGSDGPGGPGGPRWPGDPGSNGNPGTAANGSSFGNAVRAVSRPHSSWRALGDSAKLTLYLRWSLLMFVVFAGIFGVLIPISNTTGMPAWSVIPVLLINTVTCVLTGIVMDLRPELNSKPRRDVQPVFIWTMVLLGVMWVAGLAGYLIAGAVAAPGTDQPTGFQFFMVAIACNALALAHVGILPWVKRRWLVSVVLLAVTWLVLPIPFPDYLLFSSFFLVVLGTSALTEWTIRLVKELDRAKHTEAELKVSEERLRFAQQLHDTMGQHLAAMSVKTELATALARRGDDRLFDELEQLRQLTKVSAADMRSVVDGHRHINLSTEVGSARSLLESSGVKVEITGEPLDLPEDRRELAAWFVREATTNVLRHSYASAVEIHLAEDSVRIVNDAASPASARSGGLSSLRERAGASGASVRIDRRDGGFLVELSWPTGAAPEAQSAGGTDVQAGTNDKEQP